jgi:FkbM family methyltransferase
VTQINGLFFPDDVGESWKHALEHVKGVEWAIANCPQRRVALQAGGNVGLWPRRLARRFARVITFEPDPVSRECLKANVPASVEVHDEALGSAFGRCSVKHRGLGSHRVVEGDTVQVITIDSLGLEALDYLQLDIEGYEHHALQGAVETLKRCRPIVQVELRGFATKYGTTTEDTVQLLAWLGYREVSKQPGSDVVFRCAA